MRFERWVSASLCAGASISVAIACGSDDAETAQARDAGGQAAEAGELPTCTSGGIATDDGCCDPIQSCGSSCCPSAQVCFFGECTTPGKDCIDSNDCKTSEYCDFSLHPRSPLDALAGCTGGPKTGSCFPRPEPCGPTDDPTLGKCVLPCELAANQSFELTEKYSFGPGVVWMTPIVVQLDDDNCDGALDALDVPEIVYAPGYDKPSPVIAVSIVDGAVVEKWKAPDRVRGGSQLAAGDLDGDGKPEIVGIGADGESVVALRGSDGSLLWSRSLPEPFAGDYEAPAIARPSAGAPALVLVNLTLLDGATGASVKRLADPAERAGGEKNCGGPGGHLNFGHAHAYAGFADLDGDGVLDVTDGARAFRIDGTPLWDLRDPGEVSNGKDRESGYHAVADLDRDGVPEVVYTSYGRRTLNVVHLDPSAGAVKVRSGVSLDLGVESQQAGCGRTCTGGGPPTIADLNGDGFPDVGVAGAIGYIAFDGKLLMSGAAPETARLWSQPTIDCSSAFTSSSVFDFDGDGRAEVVYADEEQLFVFDGVSGERKNPPLESPSGTVGEMPVVADVDGDDRADLIVPNDSGVHVYGSPIGAWVRTRRLWNQHTYHVTNIADDMTLPAPPNANWLVPGLNNFRQNLQPGQEHLAPDATVVLAARCSGGYHLTALVRNLGQVPLPKGVVVEFFRGAVGSGELLGSAETTHHLSPGESETVTWEAPNGKPPWTGSVSLYAVVNGKPPPSGVLPECRTDNNDAALASSDCTDVVH